MSEPQVAQEAAFSYYPRLKRLKDHVDRHYAEEMSLAVAARITGLEKKYFSTFFHEKTGVCFKDWLAQVRIDRALEMLRAQDVSITRTAFAVGFQDLRTFERTFKRCTGMTPSAYKRKARPC